MDARRRNLAAGVAAVALIAVALWLSLRSPEGDPTPEPSADGSSVRAPADPAPGAPIPVSLPPESPPPVEGRAFDGAVLAGKGPPPEGSDLDTRDLALGSMLVVSGWIGSPDHVITDVKPHFSWGVDVSDADWAPRRDGRLATARAPVGVHQVYLVHESAEHGSMFSDAVEFELESGAEEVVHLELHPAKVLRGRLDESVPRPIADGRVKVGVQRSLAHTYFAGLLRTYEVDVAPDGTFEVPNLWPGEFQVVALCAGWCSKRVLDPERAGLEADDDAWVPQGGDLRTLEGEFEVAMEKAAALEVTLLDPEGAPVAGAIVTAWPSVRWRVGASEIVLDDRDWSAVTDERGGARIENLPDGVHVFEVAHAALALPFESIDDGPEQRRRKARVVSGEAARVELELEPMSAER